MDMVTVCYRGKVKAMAGARIEASETKPYPCAATRDGRIVPATWGDVVVAMALSTADKGEQVLIEVRSERPEP